MTIRCVACDFGLFADLSQRFAYFSQLAEASQYGQAVSSKTQMPKNNQFSISNLQKNFEFWAIVIYVGFGLVYYFFSGVLNR